MLIKVCGMREADNIRAVEALGIDLMGFICWPQRRARYVDKTPAYMPQCPRVGVFVDPEPDFALDKARQLGLTYLQLHGDESPAMCRTLRERTGCRIIKALREPTDAYCDVADLLLFDPGRGSGRHFDLALLQRYHGPTPFLLAGGIGPDDVPLLHAFHHPRWAGIDLNSRFETAPALKDVAQLRTFIQAL